ncbi:MAG: monofunctional biosynthetic peptidoglycan transglycosylase [Pseudomonadota bacterium]
MRIVRAVARVLLKALLLFLVVTALLVGALRWVAPPASAFMIRNYVDAQFSSVAQPPIQYRWVDYRDISPYMPLAAVAAEDQKFPSHNGFDLEAIERAVRHNMENKRVRGASTISQQVAKNLFLWPGRSYVRKGLEAYFTFLIETLWPKKRILEVYVNIAEMGDNVFGVGAASRVFFKKPASALNAREAALLAAVLPSPARFDATRPTPYIMQRQRWILMQMNALGGPGYLSRL